MPPPSSHLLRPRDAGCFSMLKGQYGNLVGQRVRLGFNHIDKFHFLATFPKARRMTYEAKIIQNSFRGTCLVPFDPESVNEKLTIQLRETNITCFSIVRIMRNWKNE